MFGIVDDKCLLSEYGSKLGQYVVLYQYILLYTNFCVLIGPEKSGHHQKEVKVGMKGRLYYPCLV